MSNQHPITPPPELVQEWCHQEGDEIKTSPRWFQIVATQAARWGADQELEACCEWIYDWYGNRSGEVVGNLIAHRRPRPTSLKEQALTELEEILDELHDTPGSAFTTDAIRRALEALDD